MSIWSEAVTALLRGQIEGRTIKRVIDGRDAVEIELVADPDDGRNLIVIYESDAARLAAGRRAADFGHVAQDYYQHLPDNRRSAWGRRMSSQGRSTSPS